MQGISYTTMRKDNGRNKQSTHNVAFLIGGSEKHSTEMKGDSTPCINADKNACNNIPKDNYFPKMSYSYENFSNLDDQEMSLSCKMELFYSKSESSFGVEQESDLDDQEQKFRKSLDESGIVHSSISSSKEDLTGTDSLLSSIVNQEISVDKFIPQLILKEPDIGVTNVKFDSETETLNIPSITGQSINSHINSSRICPKLNKRASIEVSLPSSFQEPLENASENNSQDLSIADIAECSPNSFSSSLHETLNCPTISNLDGPKCIIVYEDEQRSDSESENSSGISPAKNLQDEIDKRIAKGQMSGSLDFSNMRLPFFPSALLSFDVSMINRLNLHDNQLVSLSGAALKQLVSLTWLDLRFNKLKDIPREIGHLKLLKVLLLQGNNIQHLPVQLGFLSDLKTLQFTDNPIKYPPKHIRNGGLEIILKFMLAVSKRKKATFKTGSETSSRNSHTKTKQNIDTTSITSLTSNGEKSKYVKTMIEIESQKVEVNSIESYSINNESCRRHQRTKNSSDDLEEPLTNSGVSNTNELATALASNTDELATVPAIADDTDILDSLANTEDDATSTIGSMVAADCIGVPLDNSDDEECECSTPVNNYQSKNVGHREPNEKALAEARLQISSEGGNEDRRWPGSTLHQQGNKTECDRITKRLCEQIKENSLKEIRRKSLHLILKNATSDDEKDVCPILRCLSCHRRINQHREPAYMQTHELTQVPVTEMLIPDLQEANDPPLKLKKRKKLSNGRSSKLIKPKLTSMKKVEKRIRQDRLRMQRTTEAEMELQKIQRIRSKLGLQSWREDTKLRQETFAQNFSEYDFVPPFAEAPFAIDERHLPPRLRPKTPTFSKLNERQRKLSSIESDIKECLRKLGAQQEKRVPSEDPLEGSANLGPLKKPQKTQHGTSTNETTAVLNQLNCLRRQIQRLKLDAFI